MAPYLLEDSDETSIEEIYSEEEVMKKQELYHQKSLKKLKIGNHTYLITRRKMKMLDTVERMKLFFL